MTPSKALMLTGALMTACSGLLCACSGFVPAPGSAARPAYYAQVSAPPQTSTDQSAQPAASPQSTSTRRANTSRRRRATTPGGVASSNDPDNAPVTKRDVRDPNQQLTTPRDAPVPGAPNPLGPTVNPNPQD